MQTAAGSSIIILGKLNMDKYPIPYSFGMEALEEWAREMIGAMLRLFPTLFCLPFSLTVAPGQVLKLPFIVLNAAK